jgi:hypothetical protein
LVWQAIAGAGQRSFGADIISRAVDLALVPPRKRGDRRFGHGHGQPSGLLDKLVLLPRGNLCGSQNRLRRDGRRSLEGRLPLSNKPLQTIGRGRPLAA